MRSERATAFIAYISATALICFAVFSLLPVRGEAEIYSDVIRLHVLARSDSEEDQSIKLAVRDAVLEFAENEFADIGEDMSFESAYSAIEEKLGKIKAVAEKRALDYYDEVNISVSLSVEDYPTREYEGVSLPAGAYNSLRIIIDGGEGKNWWCVLYPPFCLRAASAADTSERDRFSADDCGALSEDEILLIRKDSSPKYKIRFKILELLSGIFGFRY